VPKVFMPSAAGSTLDCHLAPVPCNLSGGVAQLGERLPCTQEVIGSIPFTSTISGDGYQEERGSLPGGNFQVLVRLAD
jgi:hypothetical protein